MQSVDTIQELAAVHGFNYWKTIYRDDGKVEIGLDYEPNDSFYMCFGTGWCQNEQQAIDFTCDVLRMETDVIMKLLKNDKLFPHIRGVMLKDKRVPLHLSGKVNVTEMQGGDSRAEIHFTDHGKTVVINRNQLLKIIEVYGDDTNDFNQAPIVLHGEHGKWFGKEQWGIRVDLEETKKQAVKNGYVFDKKKSIYVRRTNNE